MKHFLLNIVIIIYVIPAIGCHHSLPNRESINFIENPVKQIQFHTILLGEGAPNIYSRKNNANVVIIIDYMHIEASRSVDLIDENVAAPDFMTEELKQSVDPSDFGARFQDQYWHSVNIHVSRRFPTIPEDPKLKWRVDYRGKWDERWELGGGSPSYVAPSMKFGVGRVGYFTGEVTLWVNGKPIMSQKFRDIREDCYLLEFQYVPEAELLFFPEYKISTLPNQLQGKQGFIQRGALHTWSFVRVPSGLPTTSGSIPPGPSESTQPTVGGIVGIPSHLVNPKKPALRKEAP